MHETPDFPSTPPTGTSARPPIRLERTGERSFTATLRDGRTLPVGPDRASGAFSPGELLQIALAGCHAMSADARVMHALGEQGEPEWWLRACYARDEDAYTAFDVVCEADMSHLSDEEVAKTTQRVGAAIERSCTIGHTLKTNPTTTVRIGGRLVEE
ncbi:MAG: OsmC family protein [Bowdeniella nasicola]|nr:OsmC family protein [Bowdeniella nasicola]